jgi:2-polyprenyl-6-hydroxyphenyl methylase/3-demethylubiquinone-9 3-methyltransferase
MNFLPNVDQDEATKFAKQAEEWWDVSGPFRLLHQMNPLRLHFMDESCSLPGKTVLDVGCGAGILTEGLAAIGATVMGIDVTPELITEAERHAQLSGVRVQYQKTTVETLAEQQPESFDVVTCLELLEHVPDPRSIVQACARVVKPGGHVFFSTINRTLKAYFFAILGAEYFLRYLPIGTHEFEKFIKPSELVEWLRKSKIQVKTIKGIHYHLLAKTFSLNNNVDVNYLLHAIRNQ